MNRLVQPKLRINKICKLCGKNFEVLPSENYRKFCSHECADTYNARIQGKNKVQHKCKQCGKIFRTPSSQKGSFCSKVCQALSQKNGETHYCPVCNKPFYDSKKRKRKTCSKECGRKLAQRITTGRIRIKHIEPTCTYCGKPIDKYPSLLKGQKHFFCNPGCHSAWRHENKVGYNKGIKRTESQKKQISETIKKKIKNGEYDLKNLKIFKKGRDHPCWKGGVSNYYSEDKAWELARREALKRDEYTCRICGEKNAPLDVHHRIPFRICKSHNLDDLLSVCRGCHAKLDNPLYKSRQERSGGYVELVSP